MPALNVNLTVAGDVQLNRTLIGLSNRAMDFRPAWQQITDQLLAFEKRQFTSEGAAGSGGWAPLKPATVAMKQALGMDNGILNRSGDLMRSLTVKGASGQVSVIAPHQFAFGTTIPYAGRHQNGGGNLPQRRPIELPESERRELVKTVQRHWVEGR